MTKMEEQIRTAAKQILEDSKVSDVIGYEKTTQGKVRPAFIDHVDEIR